LGLGEFLAYQSFESLEVWQHGCRLATSVYAALEGSRDFTLKDQMTRAAVSIPSNIAEGYERGSTRDFVRFLRIAQGSAGELRTQAYIAKASGVLSAETSQQIISHCKRIGAMLQGLIRSKSTEIRDPEIQDALELDASFFSGTPNPEP
jgi:four helix bundle protein